MVQSAIPMPALLCEGAGSALVGSQGKAGEDEKRLVWSSDAGKEVRIELLCHVILFSD